MRVLAISSSAFELERTCLLTLKRFLASGNEVYLLIVQSLSDKRREIERPEDRLSKLGFANVTVIEEFDYSEINQHNAKDLSSYVKSVDPSLIFMPFWKSSNEKSRILSRTALIACRGKSNVLMFDEPASPSFAPTISFLGAANKVSSMMNTSGGSVLISNEGVPYSVERSFSHQYLGADDGGHLNNGNEIFEIHRMVMLDGEIL